MENREGPQQPEVKQRYYYVKQVGEARTKCISASCTLSSRLRCNRWLVCCAKCKTLRHAAKLVSKFKLTMKKEAKAIEKMRGKKN